MGFVVRYYGDMWLSRGIQENTELYFRYMSLNVFIEYTKPDIRICLVNELGVTQKPRCEEGASDVQ